MKKLTLYLFIFFVNLSIAQSPSIPQAKIHSHFWAAGMCCANGEDFTITLILEKGYNFCFDTAIVEVDGMKISIPEKSFIKSTLSDSTDEYLFKFGFSNSYYDRKELTGPKYYGTNENNIIYQDEMINGVTLIRHHDQQKIIEIERTRSITAFP